MALDELREKGIVVKANELIQQPYTMTTQEKRLILILASTIRMEDNSFNTVRINLRELNKLIGVANESIYKEIKDITKRLMSRVIEYKPEEGELVQTHWVERAHYKEKKGYVEIKFSDEMRKYLLQLGGYFTKYRLAYALPLSSFYSIRLYEILKMDYTTNRPQAYYELEELKKIIGVVPPKYKLYGDFKRKVLLNSQEQFQKLTDIVFDFKEKKQGKKVAGITFLIRPNKSILNQELPSVDDLEKDRELYDRLVNYFCLLPQKAKEIIKNINPNQLRENLEYVETEYRKGRVENIGPYTIKAIKENYRIQKSLFDAEKQKAEETKKAEERNKRQEEKNQIAYSNYWNAEVEKCREELTTKELAEIKKAAESQVEANGQSRSNPISFNFLVNHAIDEIIAKKAEALAYDEWLAKKQ